MELVFLLARILFVVLVLGSAMGHLTQTSAMAGYAESKGVGSAKLMVQISGVALALGGLAVLLGVLGDLASLGLALLFVIMAVMMHPFWKETDAMAKQGEMVHFNKNIALAGGALALFVIFANADGNGYFTLTGAVFG
jgi:uncharacterized membrane protein YphA (DoxX/SURF4 family)